MCILFSHFSSVENNMLAASEGVEICPLVLQKFSIYF